MRNHKVLLADDSETIKKVVKITLANEAYQLIDCGDDSHLLDLIKEHSPSLVFLDFNLSEEKTGYQLCQSILQAKPKTKILMMYGHFDTVDELALKNSGASEKIIKPFDSNKFINICRNLISQLEDDLVGSGPIMAKPTAPKPQPRPASPASDDFDDWEMEVPDIIGGMPEEFSEMEELPSVIPDEAIAEEEETENQIKMPSHEDLEYPQFSSDADDENWEVQSFQPTSKLIELEQLAPLDQEESEEEKDTQIIDVGDLSLRTELENEVLEELADQIWVPEEPKKDRPREVHHFSAKTEIVSDSDIRPIVEKYLEEKGREIIESIAWEIIPELTERLIREELKKLAQKAGDKFQ